MPYKREENGLAGSRQKKIVGSTVYTIAGGLLMNGVLQAVVYPLLNRHMGSEPLGELLFNAVYAARLTKTDPEEALHAWCEEYIRACREEENR